jgi:death-on-curing protein
MEGASREVAYPTLEQIKDINRRMIKESGGLFIEPDNILNIAAIEYVLESIKANLFGVELYPNLIEKSCALAIHIIISHCFNDGNKRTGIGAALEFLQANNIELKLDRSIVDLAVEIAEEKAGQEELSEWLISHLVNRDI